MNEKRHEQTITSGGYREYRITDDMEHDTIIIISTKKINNIEKLFSNITIQSFLDYFKYIYVQEYVVTEDEYKRAVDYYESDAVKNGIEGEDYEGRFEFDKSKIIDSESYSLSNKKS